MCHVTYESAFQVSNSTFALRHKICDSKSNGNKSKQLDMCLRFRSANLSKNTNKQTDDMTNLKTQLPTKLKQNSKLPGCQDRSDDLQMSMIYSLQSAALPTELSPATGDMIARHHPVLSAHVQQHPIGAVDIAPQTQTGSTIRTCKHNKRPTLQAGFHF